MHMFEIFKFEFMVESRLEGVNRRNLKFINLNTLESGLALELNSSVEDCFPCYELLN
jgi:hypothetical protein